MIDLALKENSDLITEGENIVSDADELVQRLRTKLRIFLGELYLDTTKGVDYFGVIFKKGTTYNEIANTIKRQILETDEILTLNYFEMSTDDINRRTLRISFGAQSTFGQLDEIITAGI